MRWILALLLGSVLLLSSFATALQYEVSGTRKGVPIPKEQIKFAPYQFGRSKNNNPRAEVPKSMRIKRGNPTSSSANWCGAVNHTPTSNKIKSIHAFWQVPGCTKRTGHTYPQGAAVWTGIDGNTWTSALLQSGTVCKIDNSTAVARHEAWWQWVPDVAYTITSMPLAIGDWVEITINTTSDTSATIKFDNISQDEQNIITVVSGPTLARKDADWVVERPYFGSSLAGFPKFDTTWFEDAYAVRQTGANLGILGATQYHIPSLCNSTEYDNFNAVSYSLPV
ncbi:concanavalin A-like lectin/glucanase domain-containing protein [Triangularia verruculosa]|uniref:Concanavalin A-like lectin/glucanase domain-containing protein n=1 Tax=Triangularia verruculosa TaxID=2587418 RepID=A0AAN6XL02_9PEZI|nr:concanavalin A-like lectin/glucanase domain-containing protein [Triangularia verruculosa]